MTKKYFQTMLKTTVLIALLYILFGCSTSKTIQAYNGAPQPATNVATICPEKCIDNFFIDMVDDKSVAPIMSGNKPCVAMLPGKHIIKVYLTGHYLHIVSTLNIEVEAGHSYILRKDNTSSKPIQLWIEDSTTGKSSAKITIDESKK